MMNGHGLDLVKVLGANSGALALSLTDLETALKIMVLSVSLVYTVVKTAHAIRHWKQEK